MFDSPSVGGGSVRAADLEGHVLVVEPLEHVQSISTSFGDKDAIRVNVYDITDKETHTDVLFFGTALIGSLKKDIGKKLLGKMSKGEAKPGQSAPWILVDLTGNEKAVAAATAYMTAQAKASLSAPAKSVKDAELEAAIDNLDDLIDV
jgi:hypothetical protein